MAFKIDVYHTNPDNSCRFALGTSGSRTLFVIGLNPSTADDKQPDQTIRKIIGFAERHGFDSFVMLNLYPQRTPYPSLLDQEHDQSLLQQNIHQILSAIGGTEHPTLLAAWGGDIMIRRYFATCLECIIEATKGNNVKWLKIGDLTKKGHPRHPSRAAYASGLTEFDVAAYKEMVVY